jgi:hypothetical protein
MKIQVTKQDIRYGKRGIPSKCALARAMNRDAKIKDCFWSVGTKSASLQIKDSKKFSTQLNKIDLPKKCVKFIDDFDCDKSKVKPFEFTIKTPKELRSKKCT